MALCKRAFQLGSQSRLCFAKCRDLASLFPSSTTHSSSRHVSQAVNSNGKRAFLVDTLALVNNLFSFFMLVHLIIVRLDGGII